MQALIVGGTKGLGLELTRWAASTDVTPIPTGRVMSLEMVSTMGHGIAFEQMDVTSRQSIGTTMQLLRSVKWASDIRYLFYLPAIHLQGKFCEQDPEKVNELFQTTVFGLMNVVRAFHTTQTQPYHLVVVSSTASYRILSDETAYGTAKAAQAQFARDFHQELARDLPGSKTLIVHPGGMRTDFRKRTGVDTSKLLDPMVVARFIWEEVAAQALDSSPGVSFMRELHILRGPDGQPIVERGIKAPQ